MDSTSTQSTFPSPIPGSRRGKPGRPRNGDHGIFAKPVDGHTSGTDGLQPIGTAKEKLGAVVSLTVAPIAPRLLDLNSAAQYLGVSTWTIRELSDNGILPRVRIPLPKAGELRKLLFDRQELDELVNRWKERG